MNFVRHRGKVKTIWMEKKPSTEIEHGALVQVASGDTGRISPAASGTDDTNLVGVINKAISSSDDDYAEATEVPVQVPLEKNVEWKVAATGTAEDTHRGTEVDLSDSTTVNVGGTSKKVVLVRNVLSTDEITVVLKLNGSY